MNGIILAQGRHFCNIYVGMRELRPEVFHRVDAGLAGDIRRFFGELSEERRTFVTPLERILRSEVMVTGRLDGRLIGMVGVTRRFWVVPFRFAVVDARYQGRGIAKILYQKELPRLRRYLCVFSIILNQNRRGLEWSKSKGDVVIHRNDRFTYVCNGRNPLLGRAVAAILRPLLPPAVWFKEAWDRWRSHRTLPDRSFFAQRNRK